MQESGTIMQIKEKTMIVEFERHSMCEKCGACQRGQNAMLMEVARIGDAAIGDKVQVQLPETTVMRASFIIYGVPLIALITGLLAGYIVPPLLGLGGNPDTYAAVLGCGAAFLSFVVIHLTEKKRGASGVYAPRVVRIDKASKTSAKTEE